MGRGSSLLHTGQGDYPEMRLGSQCCVWWTFVALPCERLSLRLWHSAAPSQLSFPGPRLGSAPTNFQEQAFDQGLILLGQWASPLQLGSIPGLCWNSQEFQGELSLRDVKGLSEPPGSQLLSACLRIKLPSSWSIPGDTTSARGVMLLDSDFMNTCLPHSGFGLAFLLFYQFELGFHHWHPILLTNRLYLREILVT